MRFVTMEDADLVIIGAGISGLVNAKTFLEIHPDATVVILDASPTIGGVWAEHKLYPGLKSNNLLGTFEFSDFPMDPETFNVKIGHHIPGQTMHNYLKAYANNFNFYSKIRFSSKVESVEKIANGWIVMVEGLEQTRSKIVTDKVVLATGITSDPLIPDYAGKADFGKPLFHGSYFRGHEELFETKGKVVVVGGSKSGWDAAYSLAEKGVDVEWVIRDSGRGPAWMAPAKVTPLKIWLERLVHTRFMTWFSPCIWGDADGYSGARNFLHTTWLGRLLVSIFWWCLGTEIKVSNQYSKHPSTVKLVPWTSPFWVATSPRGILNYPTDFFEFVRNGKINVHISDIKCLKPGGKVMLTDGQEFDAEALISCTGWKTNPPLTFLPAGLETMLGLTCTPISSLPSNLEPATKMLSMADTEILTRFPYLKNQPITKPPNSLNLKPIPKSQPPTEVKPRPELFPELLHRFMAPPVMECPTDHTLAFAGHVMTISTTLITQTQALWISSYLDSGFPAQRTKTTSTTFAHGMTDRLYETLLHNRFGKWRYPGPGAAKAGKYPDFVFDALPYVDLLLGDLGLKVHRKGGWWSEIWEGYGPRDYEGLVGEWLRNRDDREKELGRVEKEERENIRNGNRKMKGL